MASLRHSYRAVSESNTFNKPTIKSLQKFFQIENGIPIHLKAGKRDNLVLSGLILTSGAGFIYTLFLMRQFAFGKIKKK